MKSINSLQKTTTVSAEEVQAWSSVVLNDTLKLEHAAVDITTDRVLYHLHLELEHSIPESYLAKAEYLTLTWPVGGIWKIMDLSDNNRVIHCLSWRTTEMNHEEVEELAKKVEAANSATDGKSSMLAASESGELPPTLFEWKMQLGEWGNIKHWFLRDIMPPNDRESLGSIYPGFMTAHLMAGFTPLEVQIEVNSLTSVDTVGQTFSADVTWEVTLPAITTIREDSVLRELLDILEFDENQFEFTNINSMQEERDMTTSLSPAGPVHFVDSTSLVMPLKTTSEFLSHLQYSRRVVAVFSEEMTLHNFPVDQQKLTLMFSTGTGVRKSLRITPALIDAGSFNIANYKLGNVFDVVHHDKVFVGEVDTDGHKKGIRFEMMLERRPEYYVTNVAIPAGIITYLCFISYAPLSDGALMDTGDRMQIVLTLLLTAVTFKNQARSRASKVFIKIHEAIRVILSSIPAGHREAVLNEYIEARNFHKRELPEICCTESGYLYVQLPNDAPPHAEITEDTQSLHASSRQKAEMEFDLFKNIYEKVNPSGSPLLGLGTDSEKPLRAARPNEAFEAGGGRPVKTRMEIREHDYSFNDGAQERPVIEVVSKDVKTSDIFRLMQVIGDDKEIAAEEGASWWKDAVLEEFSRQDLVVLALIALNEEPSDEVLQQLHELTKELPQGFTPDMFTSLGNAMHEAVVAPEPEKPTGPDRSPDLEMKQPSRPTDESVVCA
ncbi:hypothetical protein BBO99_00003197 [Phytophthora kernoviae]|uniref:Uncharacterized protein n=1 Tax=Phytophthora kernoviae TaxID=325452 RepID=A0A3R7GKB0_9STRA|nr:hypothetical protein BBI17_000709 [Phytophthora kernoviae]RLN82023.1 hypothetical protein BBO99_00003197 [Phytophthora kernoviae]